MASDTSRTRPTRRAKSPCPGFPPPSESRRTRASGRVAEAGGERLAAADSLEGVIQVAHFHPDFQFEGTDPDDVTNFTNRAPYPVLHLLREDSVERAVASEGGDAEAIVERNLKTLRDLGADGWQALLQKP